MGPLILVVTIIIIPFMVILWNRNRTKGKMLCYILRKDRSVQSKLCKLDSAFVLWGDRAYDVYPDLVRISRFPMGWPALLQELVPCALYDEEDAIPKDWLTLEAPKEGSLKLRAALDENWMKKLVAETAAEGGGFKLNWRKLLPIGLLLVGVVGLVFVIMSSLSTGGA